MRDSELPSNRHAGDCGQVSSEVIVVKFPDSDRQTVGRALPDKTGVKINVGQSPTYILPVAHAVVRLVLVRPHVIESAP